MGEVWKEKMMKKGGEKRKRLQIPSTWPSAPPSLRFSGLDFLSRCGVSRPLIPPCFE